MKATLFLITPCGICSYGQVCDMHTKQCKYKECIPTRINNGTVLGNLNEIGSKIRYKCNHGYRDKDGIKSAVCKDDGTWNVTANCTRAHVGCYTVGYSYLYEGTRQHSQSGIPCQRWDAQIPHSHTRTNPANFPEDTLSAAENYCRDPDGFGVPWCYIIDPGVRFERCGVQPC